MKLNIHKKVLILVLGTGLATFLMLGIFSYSEKNIVQKDMAKASVELGEKSAIYTDALLEDELKQTLGKLAESKAEYINSEMAITRDNAKILANAMTEIMSHPENYLPRTPPDPRTDSVMNGQTYLIFAPDVRDAVTPELMQEISIAANIGDLLDEMARSYSKYNCTAFAGSEKGWYFCSRVVLGEDGKAHFDEAIPFSRERIYSFDPRRRPWYVKAAQAQAPVVSDLYMTLTGAGEKSYQQIGASAPFYDAAGNFIGVAGLDASNEDIFNYVNKSGDLSFVLNERGEILFWSSAIEKEFFTEAARKIVAGESSVVPLTLNDKDFYLAFAPMKDIGWSFGMIVSEDEVLQSTRTTHDYFLAQIKSLQEKMTGEYSFMNTLSIVIPVALLIILFLMSTNLSRRFVKPINELSDSVREISGGNLDKKIDVHTGDEIEHLAICFNAMTDELKRYMANLEKETAEKERIATELDVAKDIQNGMLPKDFPARADFELFATMTPAKEVGGDFYDFYFLDETHLAITVADVSGKGISAALFMVISKTILNNFAETFYKQNGLAPVVAAANEQLCANNEAMMFVTVFIGVLDLESGEFTYVNAGHNPPVVYHAEENRCEFLDVKKYFVLGPMAGIPFVEQKINFKRGDLIFIYTDGVTEALNVAEEEYLPDRLINFMNST
ncbi:MAG: SpoIIE family protein phosphatase, partial [Selenomonadaceae bacterium]|nr:SpoIIE family protein phosphatase [Selenomonadaceae bacterium]